MSQKDNNNHDHTESNPLAKNVSINVLMPSDLTIEMIEASSFGDYELWSIITSLMLNFVVGFAVGAATNANSPSHSLLIWISAIFGVLFIGSVVVLLVKRKRIRKNSKTVKFKADIVE